MKLVSGVLLLFIVTAASTPHDLPARTPPPSPLSDAAAPNTELAELTAAAVAAGLLSACSPTTEAPPAARRNTSVRLPDTMEEGAPYYYYYYYYYYYEETCEVASGGHCLHPASDSAPVASTAERWGRGGDAPTEIAGPSKGTPSFNEIEDDVYAGPRFLPLTVNWTPWLPVWCMQWPFEGTLNVTRETLLTAFSEALTEYSAGIANYWAQTAGPADRGVEDGNEEERTPLVHTAIDQAETLLQLYSWMYHKLENSLPDGDYTPESLYRFLEALEQQFDWVESICNWSPSMRWTCFPGDSEVLGNFFWVMDRQQIWVQIFHRWAATQYPVAALPRPPGLWLPLSEDTLPFNVPHSRNQTPRDDGSALEVVGHGVCTNGRATLPAIYEHFGDLSSESASRPKSWPVTQFVPQDKPRNQKLFPTCMLENIRTRGEETEPFTGTERRPIRHRQTEMPLGGEYESDGTRDLPRNGLDRRDLVVDVEPEESFYGDGQPVLQLMDVQKVGQVEDSSPQLMVPNQGNLGSCSEMHVRHELGPDYDPPFLEYITCDEEDQVCQPPSKCSPMSGLVAVEMMPLAPLPDVRTDYRAVWGMPNGNLLLTLKVATACECREPLPEEDAAK